jgi:type II secretory pathway pseudopilin PulG
MKLNLRNNKALTLVEILLTVFILSVGILSIMVFMSSAMILSTGAWEMTAATSHAEALLEEMQTKKTLGEITLTDWSGWAQGEGLITLPEETIKVEYPSGGKNPLEVTVMVNWVQKMRPQNVVVRTKIAR